MRIRTVATLVALASSSLFAQSAFDGTWALNQQKSKLTGETMKIEDTGNGEIKFADPNFPYTIKTDGTKTQTPSGGTEAFEKKGDDSYHSTFWRNDQELSEADWKIADGGKSLTIHDYGTRPNGDKFDATTTYERAAAGKGLGGTWKTTAVKQTAPATMTMKMSGDDLQWDISAEKANWTGKTDGKDYPPKGPTVPAELTLAVTKQGPNSFTMTEKLKDKVVYTGTYTVSKDGKTMTVKGKNDKGEPTSETWEKKADK